MCGCVQDCREVLNYPWQFPVAEQQSAGTFLIGLSDILVRYWIDKSQRTNYSAMFAVETLRTIT